MNYILFLFGVGNVFTLILTVILVILFLNVGIIIKVENKKLLIWVRILGFIKLSFNYKANNESVKKKRKDEDKIKKIYNLFNSTKPVLKEIKWLLSKSKLLIQLNNNLVLYDPDKVALAYGFENAIVYFFDSILNNYLKKYCSKFEFKPEFNGAKLNYYIKIDYRIRFFYILIFSIKVLKNYIKYKKQR